jgi:predicted acyl esterase
MAIASAPPALAARTAGFKVGAAVESFTPPAAGTAAVGPGCGPAAGSTFTGRRLFAFEEPYVDLRHDGHYDLGDPFLDCNHNGRWDGNFLGGGGNTPRYYDHVADEVGARALVVSNGRHSVAIEAVDQEGLFNVYADRIRRLVAARGIRIDSIQISATHDESAPDSLGLGGPSQASSGTNGYFVDYLVRQAAKAIEDAYRARRPARIRYAQAQEPANLRQCWSSYPYIDDQLMPTLQAVGYDGRVIATLAGVSQHTESLGFNGGTQLDDGFTLNAENDWITSDWPHFFRDRVEHHYGGVAVELAGSVGSVETPEVFSGLISRVPKQYLDASHPAGCRTLFGASGAQTPLGYFEETARLGRDLAAAVARAVDTRSSWSRSNTIWAQTSDVCLPVDNVLFKAAALGGVFAQRPAYLPGCKLISAPVLPTGQTFGTSIKTEVAAWRIGDGEFIGLPGEVFPFTYLRGPVGPADMNYPRYPLPPWPIPHMDARYRFFDGLDNDMVGYIFPRGNDAGVPGDHPLKNPTASGTDRFGCGHSDDSEAVSAKAADKLGEALVAILDRHGHPEAVEQGRYVLPDGRLSRNPQGTTDTIKCTGANTRFAADGPAVAVWEPGRGVVAAARWLDLGGRPQAVPDRNTRGYLDARGRRHWLDVFADITGQPASVRPAGPHAATAAVQGAAPAFSAHGSVEQVYVTGVAGGAHMLLLNRAGRRIAVGRADALGGLLFRKVRPGRGYRVRLVAGGAESGPLTVLSTAPPPPSTTIYNQAVPSSGYGYLTTRDGIKLAYYVHPPQDVLTAVPGLSSFHLRLPVHPPYPTLIEYSGYGYADPAGPQNGIAILGNLMGFAVVDVNMRGTGCSGGAYDFFEPLQNLDGYDVIETVARQPWVLHHKVGMLGISYGGISQLFTAQTDPPDLAAIAPLSVIDQTQTTLYPGGILNTGFAVAWAADRQHDALPASPNGGQEWAYKRIQQGDRICRANQVLHGEAVNLRAKIRANDHYVPSVADPLAPTTFVHKIKVPVYMACQWTDEQTGGHCADLAEHFTGTRHKWFTFTNGTHVDSLDPTTYNRWCDFLQLYVAQQAPATGCAPSHVAASVIYDVAMGIQGESMPPDPIQGEPTYASALAAFDRLEAVRVLFDNGAGGARPGFPDPGFEQSWRSFPIPGTTARSWYLSSGGALAGRPPVRPGADSFTWNAHARPLTDFTGDTGSGTGGLWTATPPYKWEPPPPGSGIAFVTRPLSRDVTVVGAGAVRLWVRSSTANVDLQATISEVRPDDKETFVQNGWVRAEARKLDPRKSTLLEPVLSFRKSEFSPMPRNRFVEVTIPLYYEGHAYRSGSRIRVTITAPNGDQPIWSFSETSPRDRATIAVAYSKRMPSSLILPVIPGVAVPKGLPPCPGLRGEPCRAYVPLANPHATP